MLLLENLCNRSPGFCALVIQEETTSPLPVSCPMDSLTKLTWQHYDMVAPGYRLILLFPVYHLFRSQPSRSLVVW